MNYFQLDIVNAPTDDTAMPFAVGQMSAARLPSSFTFEPMYSAAPEQAPQRGLSAEDVAQIVTTALGSLKVYVVESDITSTQDKVKAIVEQASF